jgi:hypothetical protein
MAYCENCGSKGHDPRTLVVAQKEDQFILIGPCCSVPQEKPQEPDVEYGLELSSHYGMLLYGKFGGLKVEYRRTPEQMRQWFGHQPTHLAAVGA